MLIDDLVIEIISLLTLFMDSIATYVGGIGYIACSVVVWED